MAEFLTPYLHFRTGQFTTGDINLAWPTGSNKAINDVALLIVECSGDDATLDLSSQGFQHVPGSPFTDVPDAAGSKVQILWHRLTTTSLSNITHSDIGDHCFVELLILRNCRKTGNPWHDIAVTIKSGASSSYTFPSVIADTDESYILMIGSHPLGVGNPFSLPANAALSSITQRRNNFTGFGNGGGLAVFDAIKTTIGPTGTSSGTLDASTTNVLVSMSFRRIPKPFIYWRIYGTGTTSPITPGTLQIAEIEIREDVGGTDWASGGTAFASSADSGFGAANAFDNSAATTWFTTSALPQWVAYLKSSGGGVAASEVVLTAGDTASRASRMPTAFDVQYSPNNSVWTTLWSVTGEAPWSPGESRAYAGPTDGGYDPGPAYAIEPDVAEADEGDTVIYTVTGPDGTVYWRVSDDGTAGSADIVGNSIGTGEVVISGGVGTFEVPIRADLNTEGPETLIIDLWSGENGTGDLLATADPVTIADTSTSADYDWTGQTYVNGIEITAETGAASEGASVSVSITADPIPPDGTRLAMEVIGTVDGSDYTITGFSGWVEFNGVSGTVGWAITLDEDVTTEGPETLQIRARTGLPATDGDIIYTSPTITVADTSQAAPTYAGSADPTSAGEGGSIAITVDCTTVPVPTVLYWDAEGDINAADLVGGSLSGSFEIDTGDILASSGGFTLAFVEDLTTEGSEGFVVNIRTSPGGTIVETIEGMSITDTSLTPPVFSASVSVSSVPEGGEFTLSAIADWFLGDTLYITRTGTAGDADFVGGLPESLSLSETTYPRKTGSVVITVAQDALIEGPENITFELRTGSAGGPVVATAGPVTLIDEAYTVTVSRTTVKGGQAVEIEFRAINASPSATHGYLITGTVVAGDFTDDALSGTFSLVDGVATVTKTLDAEAAAEGALFFRVQMRRTDAEGAVLATSVAVMVYSAVEDYDAFLASSEGIRVLLMEMDHADGTEYFADYPYVSLPGDSDPHRGYDPALLEAVNFESRIDGHFQAGRIAVANNHGDYDHLLDLAWRGYEIRLYLGAPGWSRDDFRLIARQINGGLDNVEPGRLSWAVDDGMAVFRQPLPRTLLADGTPVPIALGQVFNASPVLIDRVNHRYQVNDGAIVSVTPRVNGADVTSADNVGAGTFDLSSEPSGNLTADIEGTLTTAATQIGWVASLYSVSVDGDTLSALPTWPLGLWYPGHVEAAAVLQMVCDSVGGFAHRNALGVVGVYRLEAPAETADLVLTADDIVAGGLRKVAEEEPIKTLTVRYKRNWAPASRDSLAGIIATDAELVDELTRDWRTVSVTNTLDDYPLAPDLTVETYLVEEADAEDYAEYKAALHAVPRQTWEVEAFLGVAQAVPGRTAQITYPADGWEAGRNVRILSVRLSPTPGIVKLEVWF